MILGSVIQSVREGSSRAVLRWCAVLGLGSIAGRPGSGCKYWSNAQRVGGLAQISSCRSSATLPRSVRQQGLQLASGTESRLGTGPLGNSLPTIGCQPDVHFCAYGGASLGILQHWWLLLRCRDRFSWTCCKQYTAPTSQTHATLFSQHSALCLFHSRHPQYVSAQKPLHPCHLHATMFETLLNFPHLPRPTTRPSSTTATLTHVHAPQVTGHIPPEAHSAQLGHDPGRLATWPLTLHPQVMSPTWLITSPLSLQRKNTNYRRPSLTSHTSTTDASTLSTSNVCEPTHRAVPASLLLQNREERDAQASVYHSNEKTHHSRCLWLGRARSGRVVEEQAENK